MGHEMAPILPWQMGWNHVHILTSTGRNIGRFDIEHQCPMDEFQISRRLKKALIDLGYLIEDPGK